jgi:hypothetical protein
MHSPDSPSRRRALRLIAGAPMLPLASGAVPSADAAASIRRARFVPMAAPTLADPEEMATTSVRSALEVTFADGGTRAWRLAYAPLFVTGERLPDGRGGEVVAGGCFDIDGRPIIDRSAFGTERQYYSDCPDGMSLITLPGATASGVSGNTVFAVVQFEYVSRQANGRRLAAPLPSPMAVLTLDQDPASGRLRLVRYHNVDTSAVHGLWTACGASLSPWNTHLSSEEFPPDAAAPGEWFRGFSRYLTGDPDKANPYHYGHVPEVTVHADGSGSLRKHYCLGRISHEVAQVMPDERTVLMSDDWRHGGLFLFVADRPRSLSAGTLYAAKWQQTSGAGPGAARLAWIRLGHAASGEIEALIDGGIGIGDIIDARGSAPAEPGYARIAYNGKANWVRLKPGMDRAAAFLETHRYAALRGASLGFTKMEGVALNARDRIAYVAISSVEGAMTDGSAGIRVEGPSSGAVYALNLRGGQDDSDGVAIVSEWVPVDMSAVPELVAADYGNAAGRRRQDALGNFADPDRIAGPDNLCFSEPLRTLFIGEDSDTHVNNFLWAWNVETRQLARILSCPAGAESTGLAAAHEINGWTYIASNAQHPGDWVRGLHDRVREVLAPMIGTNYRGGFGAAVGYLTAEPAGIRLHPR